MESMHILLAEDNPADVVWLKEVLDEMGLDYRLTLAQDGEQALEYLRGQGPQETLQPDLIMLDINLPKLNGIEVLQAVPAATKLPVCFVTGSRVERNFVLNHFAPAVVTYMTKPVDGGKMLSCLKAYKRLRPAAEKIEKRLRRKSASSG